MKMLHRSNHLRGQGNNFHELLVSQLASDRSENSRSARIKLFVDNDNGIAVKTQIGTIIASDGIAGPDNHGVDHFTLFDGAVRSGFLDVRFDDIADVRVALVAA